MFANYLFRWVEFVGVEEFVALVVDFLGKISDGDGTLLALALFADRDGAVGSLFLAYDEHVWDTFQLVVTDFAADLFVTVVNDGADAEAFELVDDLVGVVVVLLAYGKYDGLVRSEPERELSCCVLDEDSDETFHAAEWGAVDHYGAVGLVVSADVLEFETLWEVVVYLNCAELPFASDSVLDHEVEFRAVESGFAGLLDEGYAFFLACLNDSGFSLLPVLIGADVFLAVVWVAEGYLGGVLGEVEGAEDVEDDVHHLLELGLDLVWADEDV